MNNFKISLLKFGYIEQLASTGTSFIHRLNPLLKVIVTLIYIIFVVTVNYLDILELLIYLVLILIMTILSRISFSCLLKRSLIGLPISLCIGISNLFFAKDLVNIGGMMISVGVFVLISLVLKNILCLSAIFLLMATTRFDSIACELVHLKVPSIFVLQLVMIYRYIFLLVEESLTMIQAYQLKNPTVNKIAFKDMGSFLGTLLVRSFKRSNEIYNAMKCRGFDVKLSYLNYEVFKSENYFLIMIVLGIMILLKVVF